MQRSPAAFHKRVQCIECREGQTHPDIFVHAAQEMRVPPSHCIVLEDSASGVQAAIAANMKVIGILTASHIQPDQERALRTAGAHYISQTFAAS
jgi:beta-phosphoglucomutase-like phosphatase (HAD superfamily)